MDVAQVLGWQSVVDGFWSHFAFLFPREDLRRRGQAYVAALTSNVERKNSWQMAEHTGEKRPYCFQRLLGRASWDADAVRDELRRYACTHLLDEKEQGILIVDETGFEKKGKRSAGVASQYSGTAGGVVNCQIGVFLALSSSKGQMLIDRELYLPEAWTADRPRCRQAHIPEERGFFTKPELALQMIQRAMDNGVKPSWVRGDEVYGNDGKIRSFLESRLQPYILAVKSDHRVFANGEMVLASSLAEKIKARCWFRCSIGKDPSRMYDFAVLRIGESSPQGLKRVLLIRRHIQTGECAYFRCLAPVGATGRQLAQVSGQRWTIESCFQCAKGETGLDHYEVRNYEGWYRHVSLSMLAAAMLTAVRMKGEKK